MMFDMADPPPENVTGEKRVVHSVEHSIPWGHVALGVGLIVVAYVLHAHLIDGSDDVEPLEESNEIGLTDGVPVEIENAASGLVG